jgi:hypothetical protein
MEPGSAKAAEMEATAANNWRWALEDFLQHPEDWTWRSIERAIQETLSDNLGGDNKGNEGELEAALRLIDEWRAAGALPTGGPADGWEVKYRSGEKKMVTASGIQREVRIKVRLGLGRIMTEPPYRSAMYMRAHPGYVDDIKWRFSDRGSIFTEGFDKGKDVVVLGNKGTGKTYFTANYIATDDISEGLRCVGNLAMKNDPGKDERGIPYYTYADTLRDTLIAGCDLRLHDVYVSRLYDESSSSHVRVRAVSTDYQIEKEVTKKTRKLGFKTTWVIQLSTDVPTELQAFADIVVTKPKLSDLSLVDVKINGATRFYKGVRGPAIRHKELKELGLPVLDYETNWWTDFKVGFNMDKLNEYLVKHIDLKPGADITKQQFKLIKEYLESSQDEEEADLTDAERARAYFDMRDRLDISFNELARRVGWTPQRIRRWAKRQNVEAPEPAGKGNGDGEDE